MRTYLGDISKLALSIMLAQAAGILGAILTLPSINSWYRYLEKPSFTPTGQFISLTWTILYTLMGISAFLVWRRGLNYPGVKGALLLYTVQLAFNVLWSWAFFYLRSPLSGLAVISLLWISVLSTMLKFRKISRTAFAMMIPYISWISIAAYLNYSLWKLNK